MDFRSCQRLQGQAQRPAGMTEEEIETCHKHAGMSMGGIRAGDVERLCFINFVKVACLTWWPLLRRLSYGCIVTTHQQMLS